MKLDNFIAIVVDSEIVEFVDKLDNGIVKYKRAIYDREFKRADGGEVKITDPSLNVVDIIQPNDKVTSYVIMADGPFSIPMIDNFVSDDSVIRNMCESAFQKHYSKRFLNCGKLKYSKFTKSSTNPNKFIIEVCAS